MAKFCVYDMISERILGEIRKGTIPWISTGRGEACVIPISGGNKKEYRGVNRILLGFSDFRDPRWWTFKGARSQGGSVNKGSKSTPVVFYNFIKKENSDGTEKSFPLIRYYRVFNHSQISWDNETLLDNVTHLKAQDVLSATNVTMPSVNRVEYNSDDEYTFAVFYKLVGNALTELDIKFKTLDYQSMTQSIGASFLATLCGIRPYMIKGVDNAKAWENGISENKRFFFKASSAAQKAVDLVRGI